jgi:branched-chain amino acid transport system substrate-binding protein
VASPTGPATGSTVNVGQIGSDSGLIGSIFGGAQPGAEVWAGYVNEHGGLNGHKVHLITADDQTNPSTALSEAQTMVQQDHVIAFIALANPLTIPTIAPYLEQEKVPVIGGGDLAESTWFTNPDFFPQGASLRITLSGALEQGIDHGDKKIGVIVCVEFALICSNASSLIDQTAPTIGGQVVYSASVSLAQPDYTTECIDAKSAGANVLFLGMDNASQIRFINDCDNQDYHPQITTLSIAADSLELTSPVTVGTYTAGPVFPFNVVAPATATFDQSFQEITGAPATSEPEANAWVSGLVLQTAAKNFPVSNPTSADVLAGLYQIKDDDFGGLTSAMTYVQGQVTASPTCYYPLDVVQGGYSAPYGMQPQCLPASLASGTQ